MKYIMKHIIYMALFWGATLQAAHALAEVKANVVVNKSIITLGDLLDNLDGGNDIWVMNSPAPGKKTSVSTRYLASLTRQHDVYWQNSRDIRHITVTRKGKSIKHQEIKHLIIQELEALNLPNRKNGISFENKNARIFLSEDNNLEDITLQTFKFNQRTGKFSAVLSIPADNGSSTTTTVRGRTHAISYVPALNKTVAPGRQITAQDITWVSMSTLGIGRNIIRDKSQLIGMTPRRGLRSKTPLRLTDLVRPEIVRRGTMISILFKSGKISLSAIGKAIEGGGRGDVIRVMNSKSHKTIDAVVTGPDQVQVITGQNHLALLNRAQ
ncbi:MAG: flagellar basal body P-ring formation protein FlgA [Emcibacter sp.]|nr:flagellar basal body P-ring formation protein FlgA [Emcibacter sp.]